MKNIFYITFFTFASLFAFSNSFAQEITEDEKNVCFDNYKFGSVQVFINPSTESTLPSLPLEFSGNVVNYNNYPIVDGKVFVKIFRERENVDDANSADVVDQFVAAKNLHIASDATVPINFKWQVPAEAKKGHYRVATFFVTSDRYNLSGLSFTDDIVGNTVDFEIDGDNTKIISFDKAKVTINNSPYYFAAFPPKFLKDEKINIKANIVNPFSTKEAATVKWEIYAWDSQKSENLKRTEESEIILSPNQTKTISVNITENDDPVYLAVGTVSWKNSKSILNVRIVRDGVNKSRINFPAIKNFPLTAGKEAELFSCLHNSGTDEFIKNGKLQLDITDLQGNPIHSYTYSGDITGVMMGVLDKFVPEKNYDNFYLTAQLYEGEKLVDRVKIKYSCEEIDPTLCPKNTISEINNSLKDKFLDKIFIFVGILLAILLGAILFIKRYNKNNTI